MALDGYMELEEPLEGSASSTKREYKPSSCFGRCIGSHTLMLCLLIGGVVVGIILGVLLKLGAAPLTKHEEIYLGFPGELLMRMLHLLQVPLVMSAIVSGLSRLDMGTSGKLGTYTILFYLSTTFCAAMIGMILAMAIQPGRHAPVVNAEHDLEPVKMDTGDAFLDLLRNIFPQSIVAAAFRQTRTKQIPIKNSTEIIGYDVSVTEIEGTNILGIIAFSIALGIALNRVGHVGKQLQDVFVGLFEVSLLLITVVIWYAPIGIIFLIAVEIVRMENLYDELVSLVLFSLTSAIGLAIQAFLVLPGVYFVIVRTNPYKYLRKVVPALVTAFATASSAASLPVAFTCLEEDLGINKEVTRFVLPVGTTLNMDGTALYEAVAALYISQLYGKPLGAGQVIVTTLTAMFCAVGAAGIPQGGIMTMVMVLSALGLPATAITKVIAVDWLLDRLRTVVNVQGDCMCVGAMGHLFIDHISNDHSHEDESTTSSENSVE